MFFTTLKGTVKRTAVTAFSNIRSNGLIAISLKEDDELVNVVTTNGNQKMIIGTHAGYSVTFDENTVRDMGRTASGVRESVSAKMIMWSVQRFWMKTKKS